MVCESQGCHILLSNMYDSGGLIHMADIKHPNVHYTKLLSDGSKMSYSANISIFHQFPDRCK